MLAAIDREFNLLTLNTQFFNSSKKSAIQSRIPLNDTLINPVKIQNQLGQFLSVYSNAISASPSSTLLYCLTSPVIKRVKLLLWSEYLKLLIQAAENQQGWYQILVLGLQLYWGQVFCFAIHPNENYDQRIVIGDISKDICGTFLSLVGQQIQSQACGEIQKQEEWKQALVAAIQYCIECNQLAYMFGGLKSIIIRFNRYSLFLNALEPFIIQQKIKQIPQDILLQIATHYKVIEKKHVIKHLLLSLDPKHLDMSVIFQICLENSLFTPLIVVCPRIDNDFITPLQKMYSAYLKDRTTSMLQKCLWYIRLTFQQQLYPNEKLEYSAWCFGFRQILMWILVEDILRVFATQCPAELFEVLTMVVEDPCSSILNQDDPQILRYFNNQKPPLRSFILTLHQSLSQAMVTHRPIELAMSKLVGCLDHKEIRLPEELVIKYLQILISDRSNYDFIQNILDSYEFPSQLKHEIANSPLMASKQQRALFKSDLLEQVELCLDDDGLDIQRFVGLILRSLHSKRAQTIKVISLYFERLLKLGQMHLKTIMQSLNTAEQYSILKRDSCPGYLEFLNLLNSQSKRIRSLQILSSCLETPHDVLNKTSEFPLDELEAIFLRTKHKEGLGHIYAKIGRYELACELLTANLLDALEESVYLSLSGTFIDEALLECKFDLLYMACLDSLKNEDQDRFLSVGRKIFNFGTFQRIWSLISAFNEENCLAMVFLIQVVNRKLSEYYNFVGRTNLLGLVSLIESEKDIFGMSWIKWGFKHLLKSQQIDIKLTKKASRIIFEQMVNQKIEIFHENASSSQHQNRCFKCEEQIVENDNHIVIRQCGHSTHQMCLLVPFCEICVSKLKMQLEIVLENLKKPKKIDLQLREHLRKEHEQIKNQKQLEEEFTYNPTEADMKLYEEQKMLLRLEQFDQYIESQF